MRVAILGSGRVGQALGAGFVRHGHEVYMGTRDPASEHVLQWLGEVGVAAKAASYEEAARWCEIAVLVASWPSAHTVCDLAGPGAMADKVVIDVTNPLGKLSDGTYGLLLGGDCSGGEQIQQWLPDSHVVKAFNSVGAALMVDPDLPGGPPTMPICGNSAAAKDTVSAILDEFGWEPLDLGVITAARAIEPMTLAWILYSQRTQNWDHAWKMLRR